MDAALGNLICHQGQVISQSARWLEAFYQVQHLQTLVDQRLEQNADDPWVLENQALLLIDQGRPGDALRPLRRALQLYPAAAPRRQAVQTLLVDTLLQALHEDFDANSELAAEVDRLIEQPEQREEYLRLMANGLERSGQHMRAFAVYLEIAQSREIQPRPGQADYLEDHMQSLGRDLQVRRDRWLKGVFDRLLTLASDDDRGG